MIFEKTQAFQIRAAGNRDTQPDTIQRSLWKKSFPHRPVLHHLTTPCREQARRHDVEFVIPSDEREHLIKNKLFVSTEWWIGM